MSAPARTHSKLKALPAKKPSAFHSDPEAERCVLASVLHEGELLNAAIAQGLRADHFSVERHQQMFAAMRAIHARGEVIDRLNLAAELRRRRFGNGVVEFLTYFDEGVPHLRNIERYVSILQEKAQVRSGLRQLQQVVENASDETRASEIRESLTAVVHQLSQPAGPEPDLLTDCQPEDVGNAQRLIAMYGTRLRFCHALDKWLCWDGRRWEVDNSDHARELTHKTMLAFGLQAVKANNEALTKFAAGSRRGARITNAMREAQPYQAISPAELDTHPDLLNFLNGTVDLRTGAITAHNPEQRITKLVHHNYRPEARCPVFLSFLARIMGAHPDASESELARADRLTSYLQRAFGYSLTGHTVEKAVFLLHGGGDNGKSTLLTLFLKLLEEYSKLMQIESLMVRQENNNSQADLADLRGARFVMTSETEEGQRLAEGRLKRITQGMGKIKAAHKYENLIEFDETHKLWIDANHLPIIRGTDNAIWNRLHPIPFSVTIPRADQDPELPAKLASEAEGILAWAVDGAVRYYRHRLGKPPEVEQTGKQWRSDSDQIGRFIGEQCVTGDYVRVGANQLYLAYRKWAEEAGEKEILSGTRFGKRITELFAKKATNTCDVYLRIGLRA